MSFDEIETSKCKRNILYLDCCHSGIEPSDIRREDIDDQYDALGFKTRVKLFANLQTQFLQFANGTYSPQ